MPLYPRTPSSLASFTSRLVLPFWYRLTQVVVEKRPLNGCSSSSSSCSSGSSRHRHSSSSCHCYEYEWDLLWYSLLELSRCDVLLHLANPSLTTPGLLSSTAADRCVGSAPALLDSSFLARGRFLVEMLSSRNACNNTQTHTTVALPASKHWIIIIIIAMTMFTVLSSWPKSLREFTRFIWWM